MGPTCTLGAADEGWPRFAGAPLAGPGEQDADLVLRVRIQVPELVGLHVDGVDLRPGPRGHAVLDLLAHDGAVPDDGVGVELDDKVGGASPEQLGGGNGCGGFWKRAEKGQVEHPPPEAAPQHPQPWSQVNTRTTTGTTISFYFSLATVKTSTLSLPRQTHHLQTAGHGTKSDPPPRGLGINTKAREGTIQSSARAYTLHHF